jgi:ectoine hydroxylase-related dioxygenase (phytanoyl-CoA dioxygenase family)
MDISARSGLLDLGEPLAADARDQLERDGYLVLRDVLGPDEVRRYADHLDRSYLGGPLSADGSMHRLDAVSDNPEFAALVDHPRVLPVIWSILGWNVHVYHSHIDVHPTVPADHPFRYEWHQDGGRQNRELETNPRPRMSLKVGFWLSDVSEATRGNLRVAPGSHLSNWIDGPPHRDLDWPDPDGAIDIRCRPGDAVVFDRRLWHARSRNRSPLPRRAVFFAYTYRWIVAREHRVLDGLDLTPIQRQLLAPAPIDGDEAWGHHPERVPLFVALRDAGLLDSRNQALRR